MDNNQAQGATQVTEESAETSRAQIGAGVVEQNSQAEFEQQLGRTMTESEKHLLANGGTLPYASLPSELRASVVATENVARVNLRQFIDQQDGKFVGIDFIKKDGSERALNGRLGVVQHQNGGANTTEALDRSYLTIYDMQAPGYRNVDLATVSRIRAGGKIYDVIG